MDTTLSGKQRADKPSAMKLSFFCILLLVAFCQAEPKGLFETGKEYVFDYEARSSTGEHFFAKYASVYGYKGHLIVQAKEDAAIVKLSDLSYYLYNGPAAYTEKPEVSLVPAPEYISDLYKPFEITYWNGTIKSIIFESDEHRWSKNMKQAIASQLQIDRKRINLERYPAQVFDNNENSVFGLCPTHYEIISLDNTHFEIRKHRNHGYCSNKPKQTFTNENMKVCGSENQENIPFHSSSRADYDFVKREGHYVLDHLHSYNTILVQPFGLEGLHQYSFSNHTLDLDAIHDITEPLVITSPMEHDGLTYEFPKDEGEVDITKGEDAFEEFGLKEWSQDRYEEELEKQMETVLKASGEVRVNEDIMKHHRVWPQDLLYYVHAMDYVHLKELYEKLIIRDDKALKQLFLDVVTLSGSNPAALLIKYIVTENKESIWRQVDMLVRYPFNLRHPSLKLVEEFKKVFQVPQITENHRLHDALALSFSILLIETCPVGSECHETVVPEYGKKLVEKFVDAAIYEDKLTYLQAISNLECAKTAELLWGVLYHEVDVPKELRFLAVFAVGNALKRDNELAWSYFLPLFLNRNETREIRMAAFSALTNSQPSFLQMQHIVASFADEPDVHVKQYVYTTIKAGAESIYPCFNKAQETLEFALRHIESLTINPDRSGVYESGYIDEDYGFGWKSSEKIRYGYDHTEIPTTVYANYHSFFMDRSKETFSLYVRLQGVENTVHELVYDFDSENLKMSDLLSVLEKLNIHPRESTPLHIDVVLQAQGKAVFTLHFNESIFDIIEKHLKTQLYFDKDFDLNFLHMTMLYNREVKFPTDLGLPLVALFSTPMITTVRGNLTRDVSAPLVARENNFDFHQTSYSIVGIVAFNPFGDIMHGITRSNLVHTDIPVHSKLSLNIENMTFKFAFHRTNDENPTGIVAHTQSEVFVYGDDAKQLLYKSCPTCKVFDVVSKGPEFQEKRELFDMKLKETSVHARGRFFNCEKDVSRSFVWEQLRLIFDKDSMDEGFKPLHRLSLALIHLRDTIIMAPRSGSCGLLLQVSNNEEYPVSEIEGVVKLKLNKFAADYSMWKSFKHSLKSSITFKGVEGKSVDRHWDLNVNYDYDAHDPKTDLKVQFARTVEQEAPYAICFELKNHYPAVPADVFVLPTSAEEQKTEGQIELEWGEAVQNKCPTIDHAKGIQILYQLSSTEELRHLAESDHWPYKQCREDHEREEWKGPISPITPACYNAVYDQTTPRKFHYNIKFVNLPEKTRDRLTKVVNFLRSLGDLTSGPDGDVVREVTGMSADEPVVTKDEMDLTFEFSVERPEFDLAVKTPKYEHTYHHINYGKQIWNPKFFNTRFPLSIVNSLEQGSIGRCTVNSEHVRTLANETFAYESVPCYTLVSADCDSSPMYAVFVKRVVGTNKLALKIYTGGNYIEIIPSGEEYTATINGETVEDLKKGENFPKDKTEYDFRVWEREHIVSFLSDVSDIYVKYGGNFVTVVIPDEYHGKSCGLCGDFDSIRGHEFEGPQECLLKDGIEFGHAYTLHDDDTCKIDVPSCSNISS